MADKLALHDTKTFRNGKCFEDRVVQYRNRINERLADCLDADGIADERLADAMRYAALGPGKRVRPLLVYASAELLGIDVHEVDAVAVAIEMIHTYSLVHDDLPAMDDDDLRRGRPTVHTAFDEATAILVGDALQALAFQVLARPASNATPAGNSIALVRRLAEAAGPAGMVGGQALDIEYSGTTVGQEQLEDMFARKTGRLIEAAITMPLECADVVPAQTRDALSRFARNAGLCFQIHDDILDMTATTEQIGKPSGSDVRNDRAAYPVRFGLAATQARASVLYAESAENLEELGDGADGLRWLLNYIVNRDH